MTYKGARLSLIGHTMLTVTLAYGPQGPVGHAASTYALTYKAQYRLTACSKKANRPKTMCRAAPLLKRKGAVMRVQPKRVQSQQQCTRPHYRLTNRRCTNMERYLMPQLADAGNTQSDKLVLQGYLYPYVAACCVACASTDMSVSYEASLSKDHSSTCTKKPCTQTRTC